MEILCIITFNIIIYYKTVWFGLVMDDLQWEKSIRERGFTPFISIRNLNDIIQVFNERFYSGTTFGTNSKIEHAFSILLHTTICVLIYLVLGHNHISFWGAILYACNPINNQTSIWLNGRRYALNIILVLLMLATPLSSFALYPLTLFLQVSAFFTPILLMKYSPWYILMIPALLILGRKKIYSRFMGRFDTLAAGDLKTFRITRLVMIVKTFGFFFFKMIIPGVCAMQYPDRFYWGLTKKGNENAYAINKDFYKGAMAILICASILIFLPNTQKGIWLFMALATLQWSAVLPITQILSDRYCSMPNIFMMFFLSYFASFTGMFYIPIMVIICCYYLICLSVVMPMYRDINTWYAHHLQYFPNIPWPRTLLIADLMTDGKKEGAAILVFDALNNNKNDYSILMWAAIMHIIRGDLKNANIMLSEAENNLYLGQEDKQREEINNIRVQILPKKRKS